MIPEFRPIIRNANALTILGNYWPRKIDTARFPVRPVEYDIDSSTLILVLQHEPECESRGDIIFVHGLEGSANAGYIQSFAQTALLKGFTVHRMNLRSCGGTEEFCDTLYHSGLTSDTLEIALRIRRGHQNPLFLIGFSLGGNVALKLAGEIGPSELFSGVVAISTPIDLAACVRALDRPWNILYGRRFLKRLRERVRRKSNLAPHLYSEDGLQNVKTIWEFDDRFTAPLFGFGTAANYYATQSAVRYLDAIRTPSLIITAKDDPLVPFDIYDQPAFRTNPALSLITTESGGHLGFLSRSRPRFWVDNVAMRWIEGLLNTTVTKGTTVRQVASV